MSDTPVGSGIASAATNSDPRLEENTQATVQDDRTAPAGPNSESATSTPTFVLHPTIGARVGVYRLDEKLGEGGMGAVWKAFHLKLQKHVALKVLPPSFSRDPRLIARFEREMKAVGKVDHPNVVRAMDAGEFEGLHYLVMEYVEGTDLAAALKLRGPLPVREACELVRQAAIGLAAAHRQGLVHRDVKPSNLFVTRPKDGSLGIVKLLDLGLARVAEAFDGEEPISLTGSGQVVGTPDYMAPEQWDSTPRQEGATADLYSLGCTMFCLLAGRAPFADAEHSSLPKKMAAHLHEPIPDLQVIRSDAPKEVVELCQRLTAKSPKDRVQSADELAAILSSLLARLDDQASISERSVGGSVDSSVVPPQIADATVVTHSNPGRKASDTATETTLPSTARMQESGASYGRWIGAAIGVGLLLSAGVILTSGRREASTPDASNRAAAPVSAENTAIPEEPSVNHTVKTIHVDPKVEAIHDGEREDAALHSFHSATDFRAAHSMSTEELKSWIEDLPQDFRPIDISHTANSDPPRFNAVAVRDDLSFEHRAYYDLPADTISTFFQEINQNVLGLLIATPFQADGKAFYHHVWRKPAQNWTGLGCSRARLGATIESVKRGKMRPIQIHAWPEGSRDSGLGLINRPGDGLDWEVAFDLTVDQLALRVNEARQKGWRPYLLTSFGDGERAWFGLGVVANPAKANWTFFQNLSPEELDWVIADQKRLERRPLVLVSAVSPQDATPRTTGIWVEYRPNGSDKTSE